MKKYISANLRVINVNANDIIATSDVNNVKGSCIQLSGERHSMDEDYEVY